MMAKSQSWNHRKYTDFDILIYIEVNTVCVRMLAAYAFALSWEETRTAVAWVEN